MSSDTAAPAKQHGEMLTLPETIPTQLHTYSFNTRNPGEKAQWQALRTALRTTPGRGRCMHAWGGDNAREFIDPGPIDLETACVFDNQWNGRNPKAWRVFDWWLEYRKDSIARGHYLDITPQMIEAREKTWKCGYCGAFYWKPIARFCDRCLDSPYLKAEELHYTRLLPVAGSGINASNRAPLTPEESADRLPLYIARQTTGTDSRAASRLRKDRADIEHKYEAAISNATTERDGMVWIMDHNVPLDNVIYYTHTGRFGFGWRSPLGREVKSALLNILCEFPFDYDINK